MMRRIVLLHKARGQNHGREGHGDIVLKLGVELLCHDAPGRAAGGAHEVEVLGDVLHEVPGLLDRAHVRADGDLHRLGKAEDAHRLAQLGRGGVLAVLADEGRRDAGDDLVALRDGLDELEYLALVRDGGEGAVHEAHAAGDALVVIYLGVAALVGADGVHAAGLGAGALYAADGVVGALAGCADCWGASEAGASLGAKGGLGGRGALSCGA